MTRPHAERHTSQAEESTHGRRIRQLGQAIYAVSRQRIGSSKAIFIDRYLLSLDELLFQVFEIRVVEVEWPLGSAIRHTASPAQHVNGLIQHRIERHGFPCACLVTPQLLDTAASLTRTPDEAPHISE